MSNARNKAIITLLKIETDGAYSNIAIDKMLENCELSPKDKAFATSIVYGTLERKLTLEHIISKYSKTPLKKIKPFILICLETALYQILYMDKIPDSAAVNETVKIVRKFGKKRLQYYRKNGIVLAMIEAR